MKQEENHTLLQDNTILLQQLNIQFHKGEKDASLQYINSKLITIILQSIQHIDNTHLNLSKRKGT
jgi:hypothetical protein